MGIEATRFVRRLSDVERSVESYSSGDLSRDESIYKTSIRVVAFFLQAELSEYTNPSFARKQRRRLLALPVSTPYLRRHYGSDGIPDGTATNTEIEYRSRYWRRDLLYTWWC